MNDDWRFTAQRITKYNPRYRNANGAYTKNEWTSFCDIGKSFDGVELTPAEYFRTEAHYIASILLIMQRAGYSEVRVRSLEKTAVDTRLNGDLLIRYNSVVDGEIMGLDVWPTIVQLILREYLWAELVCSADCIFRFGYDYYMYFNGIDILADQVLKSEIEVMDLFID
ncbi:hypothetical protein [Chitinophaga sp. Cy-1792]|uniref:hypothetical protein n=1 Tax=Chitinophaga sp. Cy-1792 TaxID=2608339 RepID=UPI00141F4706|nr:hypothetical protein [Chitinophaga sp. Cy-1792]NIG55390.1 hypothetical protein [Chitinophaga sp. Cy-1792]